MPDVRFVPAIGMGEGTFESQMDEAVKGEEFVQIDCTSGNDEEGGW